MKTSRNYWPLGVTLTLLLFFLGTVGLIIMACLQRSDLVTTNYYEDEIRFQKQIDRVQRTQLLETKASAIYDSATQRITVSVPLNRPGENVKGQIQLYRPSNASLDENYAFKPDAGGTQTIDVSRLPEGLWRLKISWNTAGEDYYLDQRIVLAAKL